MINEAQPGLSWGHPLSGLFRTDAHFLVRSLSKSGPEVS
jgi:hypothetical protein